MFSADEEIVTNSQNCSLNVSHLIFVVDLHRGEEPAIKTRRFVVILLGDAQRLAVLVVVRGPPVRGHSVVEQFAAVGVWRSRRTCSTQAASARWGIHWSSCEIFVPKSAS